MSTGTATSMSIVTAPLLSAPNFAICCCACQEILLGEAMLTHVVPYWGEAILTLVVPYCAPGTTGAHLQSCCRPPRPPPPPLPPPFPPPAPRRWPAAVAASTNRHFPLSIRLGPPEGMPGLGRWGTWRSLICPVPHLSRTRPVSVPSPISLELGQYLSQRHSQALSLSLPASPPPHTPAFTCPQRKRKIDCH